MTDEQQQIFEAYQAQLREVADAVPENERHFELYWGQGDELSEDQISKILADPQQGKDDVTDYLTELNSDTFYEYRHDKAKEWVDDLEFDEDDIAYLGMRERLIEWVEQEILCEWWDDVDLKQLIRNTGDVPYIAVRSTAETYVQAWRGVSEGEGVEEICDILGCSPSVLQHMVPSSDDFVLPHYPERIGNGYISDADLRDLFDESNYGGKLIFMCSVDLEELKGGDVTSVTVHKGTLVTLHCYTNGATSMGMATLLRDLTLDADQCDVINDGARKYGAQSCCDFTRQAWSGSYTLNYKEENGSSTTED